MQHRELHLRGLQLRFLRHGRPCVGEPCELTGAETRQFPLVGADDSFKFVEWENTKAVGATFRQLVASNSCSAKINDETPILTT